VEEVEVSVSDLDARRRGYGWYVRFDECEGLLNRQQVISMSFHPINLLTPLSWTDG